MGHGLLRSKTETGQAALPGQDYMYPFGVIGVASRYLPAGAVIELAEFRLGCTSTPTGIRETQAGGNRIQGHLSRGGPESRADSGSQRLIPWWSRIAHLSVKSHPGIAPGPFLNQYISWVMYCGRGRLHLRAQPSQEHLHGLRQCLHLRPPPNEEQVQGLQVTPG